MEILFRDIKKHLGTIDWFLVICVFIAMGFGFLAIRSATNVFNIDARLGNQTRNLIVQAFAMFLGVTGMFILSKSDYMHILKYCKYLYLLSVVMLAVVLIFGVGDEVGNRSWLRFGPVGIQPSEFAKLALIMTVANHLDKNKKNINHPKNIIILCVYLLIPFGLILAAGDLGNNLIYGFIFVSMCFVSGISLWYFLGGAFVLTASLPLLWNWERLMPAYRRDRIMRGFDPTLDPDGVGFQARRSMEAIRSGGLFGQGYQQGQITQWRVPGRIPEQWTDFIFSAIGEEFGFVGAVFVLIILTLIIMRILVISRRARNNAGSLVCAGVMSMFIAQTVVNIGMNLGMLPVIGVTLPLFSYGGSSVLSLLLSIGLVLSVNSRRNIYYFMRDENLDKY